MISVYPLSPLEAPANTFGMSSTPLWTGNIIPTNPYTVLGCTIHCKLREEPLHYHSLPLMPDIDQASYQTPALRRASMLLQEVLARIPPMNLLVEMRSRRQTKTERLHLASSTAVLRSLGQWRNDVFLRWT